MSQKLSNVDMKELEEQLESAIQEDKKYWLQNEAKLKAVSDHVETYNEFKNLVDAAHLTPLDKSDKLNKEKLNRTIWNKFADKDGTVSSVSIATSKENVGNLPEHSTSKVEKLLSISFADKDNFLELLNQADDKLSSLMQLGAAQFVNIFQNEISTTTILEVFKVLLGFDRNNVENIVFVAEFLGELINIERFSLTLSFLTSSERQTVESLFEKLNSCFILKSLELKEYGLVEDHLSTLKIVYQL